MEAKTYRVRSIDQALELIRQELGPDASVLHTRKIDGGLWSWWRGPMLEVVASNDLDVPHRFEQWLHEIDEVPIGIEAQRGGGGARPAAVAEPSFQAGLHHIERADQWGGSTLAAHRSSPPPSIEETAPVQAVVAWNELHGWLLELGSGAEIANRICLDLQQRWAMDTWSAEKNMAATGHTAGRVGPTWEDLALAMSDSFSFGGTISLDPSRCRRVALVGPTGVGKTTTIAKLAGEYRLRQGCTVGLITVDTFRVGAVDQLRAYAEILGVRFAVVADATQMAEAIDQMADLDLVMIDTIGRSPRDQNSLQHLETILHAAQLDQVFVTLAATGSATTLSQALAAYQPLADLADSALILTKIDECQTLTALYPFFCATDLPWSYWTNGQNVPDDLGMAAANAAIWFLDEIEIGA